MKIWISSAVLVLGIAANASAQTGATPPMNPGAQTTLEAGQAGTLSGSPLGSVGAGATIHSGAATAPPINPILTQPGIGEKANTGPARDGQPGVVIPLAPDARPNR